jgi:hypothetical protein
MVYEFEKPPDRFYFTFLQKEIPNPKRTWRVSIKHIPGQVRYPPS